MPAATTVIVACQTIEAEVNLVRQRVGCRHDVRWIESGLHNVPSALKARLQEELDGIGDCERVLLVFGLCGNAILGLRTGQWEMVVPRVGDCISLLLGSETERQRIGAEAGTYFVTKGWMSHESNLYAEYLRTLARLGPEKTRYVFSVMLAHYRRIAIIDTGACDYDELVREMEPVARTLGLPPFPLKGTLSYLEEMLSAEVFPSQRYATIAPNSIVAIADLFGTGPDTVGARRTEQ